MYNPSNNDIDDTDIDELLEDIAGGRCNVSGAVQKISAQWLEEFIDYDFKSNSYKTGSAKNDFNICDQTS